MTVEIKMLEEKWLAAAVEVWNEVVEDGEAFPQTELLTAETGRDFFAQQSYTGVAWDARADEIVGVYILHPNNVGRCGHLCNASYAVRRDRRGRQIGETLVRDCMRRGRELGFRILQFNAVVRSNTAALMLYRKLGFTQLGVIPEGFQRDDGSYEDIIPHYIRL